jgi:hypothetical protein
MLIQVQHEGVVAQVGPFDRKPARVIGDGPPHAAATTVTPHDQIKSPQFARAVAL